MSLEFIIPILDTAYDAPFFVIEPLGLLSAELSIKSFICALLDKS